MIGVLDKLGFLEWSAISGMVFGILGNIIFHYLTPFLPNATRGEAREPSSGGPIKLFCRLAVLSLVVAPFLAALAGVTHNFAFGALAFTLPALWLCWFGSTARQGAFLVLVPIPVLFFVSQLDKGHPMGEALSAYSAGGLVSAIGFLTGLLVVLAINWLRRH